MTKRGLIEELLARRQGVTHRDSETIVNAMFEAMAEVLARGERIEIRGFGSFGVKERRARQGTVRIVSIAEKNLQKLCCKLRSGLPASGVEGLPETGRPLDPEPGLGGNV